jgi:hypothetical protein
LSTFGWRTRLHLGVLAAGAAWLCGWLASFPFELPLAWRYVDAHAARLPGALAEGLLVWAGFSLILGVAGLLPLLLPLLLVSPGWIVRLRWALIPLAGLLAMAAINYRMGFLNMYHVRHPEGPRAFFFSAPNFFIITFAAALVWVYAMLARIRLRQLPSREGVERAR